MSAAVLHASPAAIEAARDLRQRAIEMFLECDDAALRAIRRNPAAGHNMGRPVSVALPALTISGTVYCKIEEGPVTACGTRTFRAHWSLDGSQISRHDAEQALMGLLP